MEKMYYFALLAKIRAEPFVCNNYTDFCRDGTTALRSVNPSFPQSYSSAATDYRTAGIMKLPYRFQLLFLVIQFFCAILFALKRFVYMPLNRYIYFYQSYILKLWLRILLKYFWHALQICLKLKEKIQLQLKINLLFCIIYTTNYKR